MSQGSFNPKIRFLGQKVWPVACSQTVRRTDTQSDYWGHPFEFQDVGPILDDRLKEKLLKPWKGALCSHYRVCLSVCVSVRELQSTSLGLGT